MLNLLQLKNRQSFLGNPKKYFALSLIQCLTSGQMSCKNFHNLYRIANIYEFTTLSPSDECKYYLHSSEGDNKTLDIF